MVVEELRFVDKLITAFGSSLFYNVTTKDVILVLKATLGRLGHDEYSKCVIEDVDLNFIVDIFYGTLVLIYGDYETSPRFGWVEDETIKKSIDKVLKEEIEYYEALLRDEDTEESEE